MKRIRISARMLAILSILDEYGSESWGDAFSHAPDVKAHHFYRSADALVRHGLVTGDDATVGVLEITEVGRLAMRLARAGILSVP